MQSEKATELGHEVQGVVTRIHSRENDVAQGTELRKPVRN